MRSDTLSWLQNWFSGQTSKVEKDLARLAGVDYLSAGYVDSQGIVQLIVDIERRFNIVFSIDGYADPRFATVGGLADMIEALSPPR